MLMNQTSDSENPAICREWRRVLRDLPVTFVWAYDTAAILPDYDDSEPGILPAGQLISFAEVTEDPGHCLGTGSCSVGMDCDGCSVEKSLGVYCPHTVSQRLTLRKSLTPKRRANPVGRKRDSGSSRLV